MKLINTISIKFNIFIAGTFQGCLPGFWPLHGPKACWKNSNNIISASFKLLLIVIDWRLFEVITIIIINVLCQLMIEWEIHTVFSGIYYPLANLSKLFWGDHSMHTLFYTQLNKITFFILDKCFLPISGCRLQEQLWWVVYFNAKSTRQRQVSLERIWWQICST